MHFLSPRSSELVIFADFALLVGTVLLVVYAIQRARGRGKPVHLATGGWVSALRGVVGFLALVAFVRFRFGPDPFPRTVRHDRKPPAAPEHRPGPGVAERAFARLSFAPCAPPPPVPDEWTERAVRPMTIEGGATLRLPASMTDAPDALPDPMGTQAWTGDEKQFVLVALAAKSTRWNTMMVSAGEGRRTSPEPTCRAEVAGRVVAVRRVDWADRDSGATPGDSTFAALTEVPVVGEDELHASVSARTRAERERLVAALLSMRVSAAR